MVEVKVATPRRAIPKATEGEIDTAILFGELNDIRKILEASGGGDKSYGIGWEEVQSHGVLSVLSSLKQRAKGFRNELDLARRRQRDMEAAGRRGSVNRKKKEVLSPPKSVEKKVEEVVEVAPAPLTLMDFGGKTGIPNAGGKLPTMLNELHSNSNSNSNSNRESRRVIGSGKGRKGSNSMLVPRRPSGSSPSGGRY